MDAQAAALATQRPNRRGLGPSGPGGSSDVDPRKRGHRHRLYRSAMCPRACRAIERLMFRVSWRVALAWWVSFIGTGVILCLFD